MIRRFWSVTARLAVMGATSYFLIATSAPREPHAPDTQTQTSSQYCYHSAETRAFHVTGTCGPEGDITVMSDYNDCAIAVRGGPAVGLPSAGRFDGTSGQSVSLGTSSWRISGYLPEGTLKSVPDAGPFTVVPSDAGPSGTPSDGGRDVGVFIVSSDAAADPRDAGSFIVTAPDASPDLRAPSGAGGTGGSTITAHGTLVSRSCTYQWSSGQPSLWCTDDRGLGCQAYLAQR